MMSAIHQEDFTHSSARSSGGMLFEARQSGLYRSDDHGETWQPAYATLNLPEPLPTTALALSPDFDADERVYAGVSGGVLLSRDGGAHWNFQSFGQPPPLITELAISPNFSRDGTLLAGTMEDGVFISVPILSHLERLELRAA